MKICAIFGVDTNMAEINDVCLWYTSNPVVGRKMLIAATKLNVWMKRGIHQTSLHGIVHLADKIKTVASIPNGPFSSVRAQKNAKWGKSRCKDGGPAWEWSHQARFICAYACMRMFFQHRFWLRAKHKEYDTGAGSFLQVALFTYCVVGEAD